MKGERNREFMDTYRKIRKPLPPMEKIIVPKIERPERFDWRKDTWKAMEDEEEDTNYKGIKEEGNDE